MGVADDQQIERYTQDRPQYESYARKLQPLIESLLEANKLNYQIVETRAKSIESFAEKIARSGKLYTDPLNELPDLCGARIIVYYADDVGRVADMVDREFSVIEHENSHQPDSFEVDRFGYLSMHSIAKLNKERSALSEWKFAANFRVEIQIRTVIQHAWSAVSHALQYKQETSVPSKLRRRLFRIAGLFELADEEFVGIRDAKREIAFSAEQELKRGNKDIPITLASIKALIDNSLKIRPIVKQAKEAGFRVVQIDQEDTVYPEIYELSRHIGITDIGSLESKISTENANLFVDIINQYGREWTVSRDYLVLFVLMKSAPNVFNVEKLGEFDWGTDRANIILSASKRASEVKS